MTKEQFERAKQIQVDLTVLKNMTISIAASKELKEEWKIWVTEKYARLEKEFEEL